jgi:8-oxo-dGTP diphosphatase
VHQNLIGSFSDEDFHIAKNDCYATLDIDMWIERYFHSSRRGIRCSGIIFIDGKLVLIGQKNKFGKEVYLFPGGGVEHKESPKDCVKREIKEEIGLDVEVLNLMYYNTVSSSWDDSLNMFYGCKVIGGDLKIPKEEEKLTEIKLIESEEELNQLRFFPEELKNKIFESKKETYSVDLGVELYKLKK